MHMQIGELPVFRNEHFCLTVFLAFISLLLGFRTETGETSSCLQHVLDITLLSLSLIPCAHVQQTGSCGGRHVPRADSNIRHLWSGALLHVVRGDFSLRHRDAPRSCGRVRLNFALRGVPNILASETNLWEVSVRRRRRHQF